MSKFVEHGRMFRVGRVLKMRFKIPNSTDLNFFVFVEDVLSLIDKKFYYARIFLDKEQDKEVSKRE